MRIYKKLSLLLLALCLLFAAACAQEPAGTDSQTADKDLTIVLDWTPNTNHTGIYVAQELGYFAAEGLKVHILQPPEDGADMTVATGQAQFGVSFQETLGAALAAENPLPITAVAAVLEHNTSGMISLSEKNITSFGDLAGHTYASWNTPSEREIINECMEAEGSSYEQLNTVPNSGADALSLMQTDDVDVVWVYEGWDVVMAQLSGLEYNFIRFADAAPVLDFYTPVIVANNEFLAAEPETVRAFLSALAQGYEYAIANPQEAAEILCRAVPELDEELVAASQEYMKDQYKAEKAVWGLIDEERWTDFYDWMYENGLLRQELGSAGFSNDYLPK